MLNRESLPAATRKVFDCLAANPLLQGFTLIGGTALALQISHRNSEDLDFWCPLETLDKARVSSIVRSAESAGFAATLATPHHRIVAAKINGIDLLRYSQDYVIGGVKVTFFARNDLAYQHFNEFPRVDNPGCAFAVMGEAGLFAMKSYVIHQRVRSRDLFDLKTFMGHGKTLDDILAEGRLADPACSSEFAKSVLIGDVPLDKEDEGFDTIGVAESIEDIHAFFRTAVDAHERALAEKVMKSKIGATLKPF